MSKYNKIAIAVLAASAMISGSAMAGTVTSTATATWAATATKDTTSNLVVTPLGSLTFDYAAGTESFNTQKGLFDVSIKGQGGAGATVTAFTLTAQPATTKLSHLSDPKNTLDVGIRWYGADLDSTKATTLVDGTVSAHGLSGLGDGSADASAQDEFTFFIADANNGTASIAAKDAMDGVYSGDVSVDFVANWTTS
ncbi:common pilus major fimbrillin subunit EcpA [Photobacterium damselae]|uniref:common pilus major fimbrillin subunit EcpA n=1 Tax=Photobacterium damselae TaxID=38293 RepID=UPI001EE0DD48|nr:common pilus major fimbrillin subunit EcpA [Photobacterium damselae]MCG3846334.1 fimbrial protein [Photobacterium damselae]